MPRDQELKLENYLAEFIGTFFLCFTVGLNAQQNTPLAPVSNGAILLVMVFAGGSVSGAHYNPAVTVGVLLGQGRKTTNRLHAVDAVIYVVVQCLAACFAAWMTLLVLGETWTFKPGKKFTTYEAGACEFLFTAALVFVVLNTAVSEQEGNNHFFGLAIGFTLMSAAFAIGSISMCCLNPALAVGVMGSHFLKHGEGMNYFFLYLLVPLAAAGVAALAFRVVRKAEQSPALSLP